MKQILLILLFAFTSCTNHINTMLVGKWNVTEATIDKQPNTALKGGVVEFQTDKKWLMTQNNQPQTGTWKPYYESDLINSGETLVDMGSYKLQMVWTENDNKSITFKGIVKKKMLKLKAKADKKSYYMILER